MTGVTNISGNFVANSAAIGGTGDVYTAIWPNRTGHAVTVTVNVSVKRKVYIDDLWHVAVCINTTNNRFTGEVLWVTAESEYYYTNGTVTVSVPNGQNLFIWNENDAYSIWTITYN